MFNRCWLSWLFVRQEGCWEGLRQSPGTVCGAGGERPLGELMTVHRMNKSSLKVILGRASPHRVISIWPLHANVKLELYVVLKWQPTEKITAKHDKQNSRGRQQAALYWLTDFSPLPVVFHKIKMFSLVIFSFSFF